jgi:signal transduction histidine kinase
VTPNKVGGALSEWWHLRGSHRRLVVAGVLWLVAATAEWAALRPFVFHEDAVPAVILYHVVGGSFAACGLLAWHRRPANRTGQLMVVTGLLFFAASQLNHVHSSLATTLALAVQNWWVIVFVALLVSFPAGRDQWGKSEKLVLAGFVVAMAVLQLVWMLFLDVPGNLLLVWPSAAMTDAINQADGSLAFAAAIGLAALLLARWLAATPAVRRAAAPALVGSLTVLALAGLLLQGVFTMKQSPFLVWPTLVGLLCIPVVFLVGVWRSWLARAAVADLVIDLGAVEGRPLQAALAKALGDPTLTLAYWLPEYGSYVDGDGRAVELPSAASGRLTSLVEQDGERVAAIVYDASLAEEERLLEAVCAAAGIALRNERLAAELRARVDELQASRVRLVDAGTEERRRLERDLHDGAQQRLVALSMQLRLLTPRIRSDPAAAEALVATATSELATSVNELRQLAQGIHPSVLDHGLTVALESLAARSTVSTVLLVELTDRLPKAVETAAYFVVSEALTNVAKYAQASAVNVHVSRNGGGAFVEVSDDGIGGADDAKGSGLRGLADRVEALDGCLRVVSPAGRGTTITALIPCAS